MSARYISSIEFDNDLDKSSYLNDLAAVKYLSEKGKLDFGSNVTFFVGENGTGKSTLLEAIAVAYGFNAEGGTRNFSFSTNNTHSGLYSHLKLISREFPKDGFFLRAESLYNVATHIEEIDRQAARSRLVIESYGGVSLHCQSHGESFLSIIQNRFSGKGLYMLDEPEAALSPMRLLTLMAELDSLVKKDSQFIIATHSPILMAFPNADILEFSEDGINKVSYKDTQHYLITKQFINAPEKMLHYLLN